MVVADKSLSPRIFDGIARTYDPVNRVLSLGLDQGWRRRAARHLPPGRDLDVLDLATGTGDLALALWKTERCRRVVGMDLSTEMLAVGRKKVAGISGIELCEGDATKIPAADERFDAVTIAFGIRNVPDVPRCLSEMRRVLRPGGRAIVLEFSMPANALMRLGHRFYLRHVLPLVGGLVSGNRAAYVYLNETIEAFPYGEDFLALVRLAGFSRVWSERLGSGIATIYVGER